MNKILSAVTFSLLIACSPANGPHKTFGEPTGGAESQSSAGYDSVRPLFAKYCAACHPSRSGPDWLDYNQASAFAKNGKLLRRAGIERSMPPPGSSQAASLSESERIVIANWARAGGPKEQQNGTESTPPTAELSPQQKVVQKCLHCHGASGSDPSAQPRIPVLAGQNEAYMSDQLQRFKWRDRIDPSGDMNDVAQDLSGEQIREVSHYFAMRDSHVGSGEPALAKEARTLFQRGSLLAGANCVSCHRNPEYGNRPSGPSVPALAGQSKIYLINQLIYFRTDERSNPLMRKLSENLSNGDIEALATFFANVH